MSNKGKKNAVELAELIMRQVRPRPDWKDLVDVTIQPIPQYVVGRPNWDATFTIFGSAVPPEEAFQIIRDLQSKFDLI